MGIELPDVVQSRSHQRIARHVSQDNQVSYVPYRWDGKPHYPLMHVMHSLRKSKGSDTDKVYARWFLGFEAFANQEMGILWDDAPERIREAYVAYLSSQKAEVTERNGHRSIHVPPAIHLNLGDEEAAGHPEPGQPLSKATLRLQHEALRTFYEKVMESKLYPHKESPMVRFSIKADAEWSRREHPFVLKNWNSERDPDRIFHLENGEWIPDLLMNDTTLGQTLRDRFNTASLRDRAVTELLLTSGARISEACGATLAGWAAPDTENQPFTTAMWVRSKGSRGVISKKLLFSPAAAALLAENFIADREKDANYATFVEWVKEERLYDENGKVPPPEPALFFRFLRARKLPTEIPLFLTVTTRKPYTASAYRQGAWFNAMQNGEDKPRLKIRPHQIRHWYVTLVLLQIERQYRLMPAQRDSARQAFARYMGWKLRDKMLEVYDRALEVHGLANQWVLIAQHAETHLYTIDVDIKTFLQEIDAPTLDEDAAPSVVEQALDQIRE